jgi:hypothetical protein
MISERPTHDSSDAAPVPLWKQNFVTSATNNRERSTQTTRLTQNGPTPSQRQIPESVKAILNPEVEFSRRMAAVHSLSRNLNSDEMDLLYGFLANRSLGKGPERLERWLRNDVMDKLVQQEIVPEGLADLLVAIYEDRQQDIVMRDYAVQHMPVVYEKMSDEEKVSLYKAMWQATEETDSSIAGTALLALLDVAGPMNSSGDASLDDHARLAETALRLASDKHCGELPRITAVSVCGRLGIKEALPVVTELAQTAKSIPLRIAAIASLGDLGDTRTETLLRQFAQVTDPRLLPAAESALRRLKERLGT